jgi:hypothetical protein
MGRNDRNLLEETINKLENKNKTENDILWIGTDEWYCTWNEFKNLANFTYDSGYGGIEINSELLVVASDFWLERAEYDGGEWWEFKQLPKKPDKHIELQGNDLRD